MSKISNSRSATFCTPSQEHCDDKMNIWVDFRTYQQSA